MLQYLVCDGFSLNGYLFQQINTAAAEVLYEKILSLAELDKESVLLDICCGTGTIGISLADVSEKYAISLTASNMKVMPIFCAFQVFKRN